jgi:transposase
MARTRRRFDAAFKAKVALEAIRGFKSVFEIAKQFRVHPYQVTMWKRQLQSEAAQVRGAAGGGAVRADRAVEGRAGVAQKKSCRELVKSP